MVCLLASCGVGGGRFRIEGKFLHINQGEFYAYSPDGGFSGVDTIKVEGGRFTFERPCTDAYTIMIVFPNFSEQPVFAESGKTVTINADASHLKEMKVEGSKTNELMTAFRQSVLGVSPPEEQRKAIQFIKDHPESMVSVYLLRRHLIATAEPRYDEARRLTKAMLKAQPKNGTLVRLDGQLSQLQGAAVGNMLPRFTAYDVEKRLVPWTEITTAPVAVIYTWASFNYDSQDVQRELRRRQKKSGGRLKLMGISLDASPYTCKTTLKRDSITSPCICDGLMLEDKTLQTLALSSLPDNIVLQRGKIVARGLKRKELYDKLDQLLK